jgi:hypothetical protein
MCQSNDKGEVTLPCVCYLNASLNTNEALGQQLLRVTKILGSLKDTITDLQMQAYMRKQNDDQTPTTETTHD